MNVVNDEELMEFKSVDENDEDDGEDDDAEYDDGEEEIEEEVEGVTI